MMQSKPRREEKIILSVMLLATTLAIVSCSTTHHIKSEVTIRDRQIARSLVIEASLESLNEEHAEAVLSLQEALRHDSSPGIMILLAKEYAHLGKISLAREVCEAALAREPSNTEYMRMRAEFALETGDVERAIADFEEIVRIAPRDYRAHFDLASLLSKQNRTRSLEIYWELVRVGYERVPSLLRIAELQMKAMQTGDSVSRISHADSAAHALERIMEIEPENLAVREMLAETYHRSQRYDQERALWDAIAERQGESAALSERRAKSYRAEKNWNEAIEYYSKALRDTSATIELSNHIMDILVKRAVEDSASRERLMKEARAYVERKPGELSPRYFLAEMILVEKPISAAHRAQALKELVRARSHAKGNVAAVEMLGAVLVRHELFPEAMKFLDAERDSFPMSENIYYLYGFAASQVGSDETARSALERALEINPRNISTIVALTSLYDRGKEFSRSRALYEQALDVDSNNALILNNYSYSLAERGAELEHALAMAEQSVKREPENGSYLDTYGWIFYKMGRYKEAAEWIEKALVVRKNATLYEHCGDAWYYAGEIEKARNYWREALQASPPSTTAKEKLDGGTVPK